MEQVNSWYPLLISTAHVWLSSAPESDMDLLMKFRITSLLSNFVGLLGLKSIVDFSVIVSCTMQYMQ